MKTLYLIGGTMGVGKTTVSQYMKTNLHDAVFLDGDWCWDADPFYVTDETKKMVLENITHLLANFIGCSLYQNIIFAWVMHEQAIIDEILSKLNTEKITVRIISLTADEKTIAGRLKKDIDAGIRKEDVIQRSIQRIGLYKTLNTEKIDTTGKSVQEIYEEIVGK